MSVIEDQSRFSRVAVRKLRAILPGLLLAMSIAGVAFALRLIPGVGILSPLIISIFIGTVIHNAIGTPSAAVLGIKFSLRRILRLAIILLGLQLTVSQLIEVGVVGIAIIVATVVTTVLCTKWFGNVLGVDRKLAQLIAVGTSICGASAVIAANTVTDATDEDVTYAVACVTLFGSIAMFVYPLLFAALSLSQQHFGLWAGSSIHEVAQVVAAAYQGGATAGEFATISKLSRVMMLAPVIIVLGLIARQRATKSAGDRGVPLPWFVGGFIALVVVNSIISVPPAAKADIAVLTTFLLSVALAAMGLETDLRKLRLKGPRPFLLGLIASVFIALFSLSLIVLIA